MKLVIQFLSLFALLISLSSATKGFPDDDRECKRHNNEGVCTNVEGHYTCGCLFHEKPKLAISDWHSDTNIRVFTQTCEPIKLPYHEDTCVVLPGNPENLDVYDFVCPNNGFFQTWGAFGPVKDNFHVRLWYRCCEVQCPKWNCQWTPYNEPQHKFVLPLDGVYVQGVRGRYVHEKQDACWSLKLCVCDESGPDAKSEL